MLLSSVHCTGKDGLPGPRGAPGPDGSDGKPWVDLAPQQAPAQGTAAGEQGGPATEPAEEESGEKKSKKSKKGKKGKKGKKSKKKVLSRAVLARLRKEHARIAADRARQRALQLQQQMTHADTVRKALTRTVRACVVNAPPYLNGISLFSRVCTYAELYLHLLSVLPSVCCVDDFSYFRYGPAQVAVEHRQFSRVEPRGRRHVNQ